MEFKDRLWQIIKEQLGIGSVRQATDHKTIQPSLRRSDFVLGNLSMAIFFSHYV